MHKKNDMKKNTILLNENQFKSFVAKLAKKVIKEYEERSYEDMQDRYEKFENFLKDISSGYYDSKLTDENWVESMKRKYEVDYMPETQGEVDYAVKSRLRMIDKDYAMQYNPSDNQFIKNTDSGLDYEINHGGLNSTTRNFDRTNEKYWKK